MKDKRKHRRSRRRLRVNFGVQDFSRAGFTADISEGGIFIVSSTLEPLDTRLHIQLFLEPSVVAYFEGVVTWHHATPPALQAAARRGFGVRFLPPAEVLAKYVAQSPAQPADVRASGPLVVRYESRAALQQAYTGELRMGGVFVPGTYALTRDEKVTVTLDLLFAARSFDFEATVLHVNAPAEHGIRGVAVAFRDPARVAAVIGPLLPSS